MKVFLMHRDRDFDLEQEPPPNEEALVQDLELKTLFEHMARGDEFLSGVARRAVTSSLTSPEEIVYRQRVLADSLERPDVVREVYDLAVEAIQSERKVFLGFLRDSPEAILNRATRVMGLLLASLKRLRRIADENTGNFDSEGFDSEGFDSEGFTRLFGMLVRELDDEYLASVEEHLERLELLRRGVLMSAGLGRGNKGVGYTLHRPPEKSFREWILEKTGQGYDFQIPDRDENGFRALTELQGRGMNQVANALARSSDHIVGFFTALRTELAFYVGCLNLHDRLSEKGEPTCLPEPLPPDGLALSGHGLYDVSLALRLEDQAVSNDLDADGKKLVVITGANQGGKSTFLRAVGLAQLMTQCGMFVAAESLRVGVFEGLFTHFKREEDASMKSGKLDEELGRMSEISNSISPGCVLLCNESFAATNEREGSEIARQVVRALIETKVRVFFVTHLYDLSHGFYHEGSDYALFLRADRGPDGERTYRLEEGEPLPTSYGEDSYERVFGTSPRTSSESKTLGR